MVRGRLLLSWTTALMVLQLGLCLAFDDTPDVVDSILTESRFYRDEKAVFCEVTFSGKTFSFLVDTGSTGTWVDKKHSDVLKKRLNVREIREAFGPAKAVQTFSVKDFFVGKLRIDNCEVATVDLSESQKMHGRVVDGILGNNVFAESVLQIDCDAGFVRILRNYQPEAGERIERLSFHQGCPVTRLGVTEFTDALVDTGNYYGVSLAPILIDEMTRKGQLVRQPKPNYLGKFKSENRTMFFVRQVNFGGLVHENVQGVGANYSTVGMDLLCRFRVTLDYPNRRLCLKESADTRGTTQPDAFGVSWGKVENAVTVVDIEKDSSAFDAGLENGDQLLRVNGQAIDLKRLAEIRRMFSEAGKVVRVDLNRGNETYSKEITLRRTFPYPPVWPRKLSKTLD